MGAKNRFKNILLGAVAGVVWGGMFAVPVQSASLPEVIQSVINTYPRILEATANRRAIDNELEQAEGLYLPQIDLRAAGGIEWTDTPSANNGRDIWLGRTESSVTLSELIFDGFGRESEIDRQASRVDAAAFRVRERAESAALDISQAYLDVLRNRSIVGFAQDNVRAHQKTLNNVRARVSAGQSGIGDAQQAEARIANARAALVDSQRDLDEVEIIYRRLTAEDPVDLVLPAFDDGALPSDLDAMIADAIDNSPTMRLANSDIDTFMAEVEAAKSSFFPSVNFEASTNFNDNTDGTRGRDRDFTALVVLRYNLYRGGIDRAAKVEAMERLSESRQRLQRFRRLVEEETRQSQSALVQAQRRATAVNDQVIANGQVVSTYRQEFQIGQRDLLDLLDAENELFNSRSRLSTAQFTVLFSKYRLLANTGRLNSTLGIQLPKEATADARGKRKAK